MKSNIIIPNHFEAPTSRRLKKTLYPHTVSDQFDKYWYIFRIDRTQFEDNITFCCSGLEEIYEEF